MDFFECKEFYDHIEYLQDENPDLLRTLLGDTDSLDAYLERTVNRALEVKKELKEAQGFSDIEASMEVSRSIIAPDRLSMTEKPLTKDEEADLQTYLDQYNQFDILDFEEVGEDA